MKRVRCFLCRRLFAATSFEAATEAYLSHDCEARHGR